MNDGEQLRFLLAKLELVHRWAAMRGESRAFNIFSLLREEHDEVGLHTVFLEALLDPRGSHGLGSAPLALFLEVMHVTFAHPVDFTDAVVERERRRGETGQIDLLIALPRSATVIVVENKIYTGDQDKQLERYHAYARARAGEKGSVTVLYLTLHGTVPSPASLGSLPADQVSCVSYHDDVLRWLSRCMEKAAVHPTLRETVVQYAELIKKLTGQSMSEETREQILSLLAEGNNAEVAQMVVSNWTHLRWRTTWEFWREMEAAVPRWAGSYPDFEVLEVNKYSVEDLNRLYWSQRKRAYEFGLTVKLGRLAGTVADDVCFCLCNSNDGGPAFYGFAVIRAGKWDGIQRETTFDAVAAPLAVHFDQNPRDDWWLGWRYFQSNSLNFVEYANPETLALVNPQKRAETIAALCSEIEDCVAKCRVREALAPSAPETSQ